MIRALPRHESAPSITWGIRMFSRSFILTLGCFVVMSAGAPRAAQAQTTALFVDSQAGDPAGGGRVASYTGADASFTASTSSSNGTSIGLQGPGFFVSWSLR